jgi:hypothetical protein
MVACRLAGRRVMMLDLILVLACGFCIAGFFCMVEHSYNGSLADFEEGY